jgi:hypothetical protein
MEHVLEQREATAAEAKRKKIEKDANKEQRKLQKVELEVQKRQRAEGRAVAKAARDLEKQEKAAARDLARQERLDAAAAKDLARQEKIAVAEARRRPALIVDLSADDDSERGCASPGAASWEAGRGFSPPMAGGFSAATPLWPPQSEPQHLWAFSGGASQTPTMLPVAPPSTPPSPYPPFMPQQGNFHFSPMIPSPQVQAQQIYTSLYSPFRPPASYATEPRSGNAEAQRQRQG